MKVSNFSAATLSGEKVDRALKVIAQGILREKVWNRKIAV